MTKEPLIHRVRRATGNELALLPSLELAADAPFASLGIAPLPPPGSTEQLANALFVLVIGDPPEGFARVEELDGHAHLEQLSVHPSQHRRGLGNALLEAAFQEAIRLGYTAMTLTTFRDVPWNAPFYAKYGFRLVEEWSPGLNAVRKKERELGLDAMGPRVVMRRVKA